MGREPHAVAPPSNGNALAFNAARPRAARRPNRHPPRPWPGRNRGEGGRGRQQVAL